MSESGQFTKKPTAKVILEQWNKEQMSFAIISLRSLPIPQLQSKAIKAKAQLMRIKAEMHSHKPQKDKPENKWE